MAKIGQKFAIEYCSYKGLTHKISPFPAFLNSSIEYCSYKGLTHNPFINSNDETSLLNIVLIKD